MLFVVTAIFIFTLFYLKNNFELLLPSNRPIPTPLAKEFASKNIFVTFLLFGGGAAIIWLSVLLRRKKILYVLILVYMADIFINGGFFNPIDSAPSSPDSYFGTNTTISKIKEDPDVFRVHSLNPRNINMIQSVESTYGYHTIETKAYHFVVPYLENSNILDLLNVKYALSAPTPPSRFIQLQPSLWLNTSFLNRVSFIPSYRLVDQVEQIVPVLTSQTFEPKKEVVIQNTDTNTKALQDFNIPLNKNNVSRATPKSSVIIHEIKSTYVRAELDVSHDGLVLFSQFIYPGWRAKVDGKEQTLLEANGFQYATPIHKGHHMIEFYFQSNPLIYGAILQISALLGVILFISLNNKTKGKQLKKGQIAKKIIEF